MMEFKNVHILACKVGKNIQMDYLDLKDQYNYSVEGDELPHPDLRKALMELQDDLAGAHYAMSDDIVEKFTPTGFSVTEKEGDFYLTIKGKMITAQDDSINITSGKLLLDYDPNDDLVVKLNTLRVELFNYIFKDKKAQQKIEFKEKGKE